MKKSNFKNSFFDNFNKIYYTTDGYDDYLKTYKKESQSYALTLIKKIKPLSFWRFLDVGCGMGGMILTLRKLNFEAWGTEVSPYCLKLSPAKKWMQFADVCHLPFPSNSFEVLTCIDVLCYLTRNKIKQAVRELTRVTKHYLFVETICKDSPNSNQNLNPDWLRKDKSLPTETYLKKLFTENKIFFQEPLYSQQKAVDFNGIFVK